ncbi:CDP-alcohol phosphatidyltransferase family protein [Aurantibacillus circumpalustris]|uniref:CDP-alcohol phosphatidyltransferase family protein n=1 Tax=Aurantibacillus circumpalustris TaxID=3036359 RepID=UPI00295AB9CE|nr:CDP-alcohol phosphatidyltransferase family protein [Aurantibacillus circumpalustris]
MELKKHIPNALTCGNLFFGCLALVQAFNNDLVYTAYFVAIALVLDFFDGFVARLLKVCSPIGKDLDSLADMVTFGVVPGVVMFQLLNAAFLSVLNTTDLSGDVGISPNYSGIQTEAYFGFIITIFSCIRLARFNNDTRQSTSFIGLPTPANTMVICSLPLILAFQPELHFATKLIENPAFLIAFSCIMSYLLLAEIPLFALKFKNFAWSDNKIVYLFLLVAVVLLFGLNVIAVPLIILLYILISIVNNIFLKNKV